MSVLLLSTAQIDTVTPVLHAIADRAMRDGRAEAVGGARGCAELGVRRLQTEVRPRRRTGRRGQPGAADSGAETGAEAECSSSACSFPNWILITSSSGNRHQCENLRGRSCDIRDRMSRHASAAIRAYFGDQRRDATIRCRLPLRRRTMSIILIGVLSIIVTTLRRPEQRIIAPGETFRGTSQQRPFPSPPVPHTLVLDDVHHVSAAGELRLKAAGLASPDQSG